MAAYKRVSLAMERFERLSEYLDKYKIYRKLLVFYMCCLILYVTVESFKLASTVETLDMGLAAVLAAIHVPITYLTGFISKLYWGD